MRSGHTAIRADHFDPNGWQLPEIDDLRQNDDQGFATNCLSAIAHLHQRPRCTKKTTHQQGTMTQHPHAVVGPRPKTSSDSEGNATFHPTNFPTSSFWFKSDTQMNGNFQNHERDLWTNHRSDHPWKDSTTRSVEERLAQYMTYVRCAAFFDTMCSILRHSGLVFFDVDPHGTPRTSRLQWGDEGNERRRTRRAKERIAWRQQENSVEADTVFSKVQGQLTYVDQEARLQFVHETGQGPEERIARTETQGGIERTSGGVFLHSRRLPSQLDGARIPTDKVRSSQSAPGHRKEYRLDAPGSHLPVRDTTREYAFEDRGNDETVVEAWPCSTRIAT